MPAPFRMYADLAVWWPLVSPPDAYEDEAAYLLPAILAAPDAPPATLLELGAGGGSLAWHLKPHLRLTLTDLSPAMLGVSQTLNPECEHVAGDMRSLDLGRTFDVVLIHDAIMYAATATDARAALATAARHCRPGGAIVLIPDCVAETFEDDENTGELAAADGSTFRYRECKRNPDRVAHTYDTVYDFVVRQADGREEVVHEVHRSGLFSRTSWIAWLAETGCVATSTLDPWGRDVFIGRQRRP
ncbi:MAG: class I SAM-dependent methyltransferase [Acidobacteriota bacterium]